MQTRRGAKLGGSPRGRLPIRAMRIKREEKQAKEKRELKKNSAQVLKRVKKVQDIGEEEKLLSLTDVKMVTATDSKSASYSPRKVEEGVMGRVPGGWMQWNWKVGMGNGRELGKGRGRF